MTRERHVGTAVLHPCSVAGGSLVRECAGAPRLLRSHGRSHQGRQRLAPVDRQDSDVGYDFGDYVGEATYYSDGLYAAGACTDYPQLFDMTATRAYAGSSSSLPRSLCQATRSLRSRQPSGRR